MGLLNLDSIPEYAEACAEERASRDLALLGDPMPLCGVLVNQLCPKHTIRLGYCRNGFVTPGKTIGPEDVAMFLWFVSTGYSFDQKARDKFVKGIRRLNFDEAVKDIDEYLESSFMDSPGGSGSGGRLYVAPLAIYVDLFGHEYGWSCETTMNTPWGTIFQLVKRIRLRYNPKALQFNPRSDGAVSRWLAKQNGGDN